MFRADRAVFWRALRAPARVTCRAGLAVLLAGGTVAVLEVPTSVHASAATISIVNGGASTTPTTLAESLLLPGVTLSGQARINGDLAFTASDPRLRSYGQFSNGTTDVGIESGLIITANADAASFSTSLRTQGVAADRPDPALGNLLETQPGLCTGGAANCIHNATDLSFSLIPSDNFIKFDYTLVMTETGSYSGGVWSGNVFTYPDGFGLFVNGESPANNCAAVPASGAYLTIKTAGIVAPQGSAAANRAAALAPVAPNQKFAYAAQNDQWIVQFLTVPLTCIVDVTTANLNRTPVSVRIVVADVNDADIPPAVLLRASSVRFEPTAPPVWQDFTLGTFQLDAPYSDGVSASGGPAPTYSVTAGVLPAGLALNANTGAVTGTPTAAGAYDFTITVTNGTAPDLTKRFTGNVVAAPAWTDNTIAAAFEVGLAVNDGVAASGLPTPTYSISAGALPAGMALNSTSGAISGTPTTSGAYSFTVRANNGIGTAITQVFSGSVSIAPAWTDQTLGAMQINVAYSDFVSASGNPAVTYSISAGVLPTGLVLNTSSGAITGTPTSSGAYDFTISAGNGVGFAVTHVFSGLVSAAPAWTDQTLGTIQLNALYIDGVSASGNPAPTYSISAGALPAGLSLNTTTGAITGTPTTASPYDFTITVTNGSLPNLVTQFTGNVAVAPAWTDLTITAEFQVGEPFVDGVEASSTPAPTYSVTAGTLPAGLTLNPTTGAITGTPTVGGAYNFTVSVSNGVETADIVFTGTVAQPAGGFLAIAPVRLLDTRDGNGTMVGGTVKHLSIAGLTGIPADASSVVLNVTATNSASSGFITVFACESEMPLTSNVNFLAYQTAASLVIVSLDVSGGVCIFSNVDTDVVIDISGAYSLSEGLGRLAAVEPYRLVDTRQTAGKLAARSTYVVNVSGGGVPSDAVAMLLNVTVDDPSGAGFVTVYPCGDGVPLASNLNFVAGQTIANSAVVAISSDRTVCFYVSTATHLIVDVNGSYSPSSAVGFPTSAHQQRLLDTRTTSPAIAGTVQQLNLNGVISVPANATAVTLNVTADGPHGSGFVTVYPCSSVRPLASNLNFVAGQTVANSVTVPVGANHTVCLFTTATMDLVVDLNELYSTII